MVSPAAQLLYILWLMNVRFQVVLLKLPNKSDAACLHNHVYEWAYHSVRFSKVDEMVVVHVDISHEVHGLVSYAGFIP